MNVARLFQCCRQVLRTENTAERPAAGKPRSECENSEKQDYCDMELGESLEWMETGTRCRGAIIVTRDWENRWMRWEREPDVEGRLL